MQDDASEDPQTAAKAGSTGHSELYFKKLVPAVKEVFATCLPSSELQVTLRKNCTATFRTSPCSCTDPRHDVAAGRKLLRPLLV